MKKSLLSILAVSFIAVSALAQPVLWDSGVGGNDHYYEVVGSQGISWDDARAAALGLWHDGLQAHLATITSQEELDFINSVVNSQGFGEMYVGGYQNPVTETDPQAGWTWVNGEGTFPGYDSASPFANWNGGEPNDAYGTASEQWLGINHADQAFNDEGNTANITGYVVEYDPTTINDVPDAGATAPLLGGAFALVLMLSRRLRQ